MIGSGPRAERETVINFNQADETATVWTASEQVYRKLMKKLGRVYLTEDGERHAVFTFPRQLIRLPQAKTVRKLSEARKVKLGEQLSRARQLNKAGKQELAVLKGLAGTDVDE